jgi:hypothetical protein
VHASICEPGALSTENETCMHEGEGWNGAWARCGTLMGGEGGEV